MSGEWEPGIGSFQIKADSDAQDARLVPARYWQLALAGSIEGLVPSSDDPTEKARQIWEAAAAIYGRLASRGVVLAIDAAKRDRFLDDVERFGGGIVIRSIEDFDRLVPPPPVPEEPPTPEEVGRRIGREILANLFRKGDAVAAAPAEAREEGPDAGVR